MWVVQLVSVVGGLGDAGGVTSALAAVEVARRTMWSFFRVENEQAANQASMTAYASIALPGARGARRGGLFGLGKTRTVTFKRSPGGPEAPVEPSPAAAAGWAHTGAVLGRIARGTRVSDIEPGDVVDGMLLVGSASRAGVEAVLTLHAPEEEEVMSEGAGVGEHFAWDGNDII